MTDEARMRVDVWLWRTRFFTTRTSASEAIENVGARIERDGQVRRIDKPATPLASGDLVSFVNATGPHVLRVLGLPARRGPASEATLCYEVATTARAGSQGG